MPRGLPRVRVVGVGPVPQTLHARRQRRCVQHITAQTQDVKQKQQRKTIQTEHTSQTPLNELFTPFAAESTETPAKIVDPRLFPVFQRPMRNWEFGRWFLLKIARRKSRFGPVHTGVRRFCSLYANHLMFLVTCVNTPICINVSWCLLQADLSTVLHDQS